MLECPYIKETGTCPVAGCPACKLANEAPSDKAKAKAEKAKADGNDAYKARNLDLALRHYSLAVNLDPKNHIYLSNRSACYSGLGRYKEAWDDAQKAILSAKDWPKGYARAGLALSGLRYHHLAAESYQKAIDKGDTHDLQDTEKTKEDMAAALVNAAASGYTKDDEVKNVAEQADAEKQQALANEGCCVM